MLSLTEGTTYHSYSVAWEQCSEPRAFSWFTLLSPGPNSGLTAPLLKEQLCDPHGFLFAHPLRDRGSELPTRYQELEAG